MIDYAKARSEMVDRQIRRRGVGDARVLAAMNDAPREAFVEPGFEKFAYEDSALPIAEGQTISQPYVVALMAEAAGIEPGARVLEVGGGSGYAAAVLSRIAGKVYVVERRLGLVERAKQRWERLGYSNIEIRCGDGTKGWAEHAPFDAILVAAGGPEAPSALKNQLKIGGRMIIPVGPRHGQSLRRIVRAGEDSFDELDIAAVAFVPLVSDNAP